MEELYRLYELPEPLVRRMEAHSTLKFNHRNGINSEALLMGLPLASSPS